MLDLYLPRQGRLRSEYNSNFDLNNIPGLQFWFDGLAQNAISSGNVLQLSDKATQQRNSIQSTVAKQAVLNTGALQGFNTFTFNGAKIYSNPTGAGNLARQVNGATVICLFKPSTVATGFRQIITITGNVSTNTRIVLAQNGTGVCTLACRRLDADALNVIVTGNILNTSSWWLAFGVIDYGVTGTQKLYLKNNAVISGNLANAVGPTSNTASTIGIGGDGNGTAAYQGDIALVAVYNRALLDSERLYLKQGLSNRYNLGLV